MPSASCFSFQSITDIDKDIETRREKYAEFSITLQPCIFAVKSGHRTKFDLKIEHISYTFDNVIKCIDVGLKVHFLLNIEYQLECNQCWLFIQKYFYNINCDKDAVSSKLRVLLSDLRNS